jgi:putative DNA primase/helicase
MLRSEDPAVGHWESILIAAGMTDDQLRGKDVDCPMCQGKKKFRFDNKEQRGTWYCNGNCNGAGDGYKILLALKGESFREAKVRIAKEYGGMDPVKVKPEVDHRPVLNRVWSEALPGGHKELQDYFRQRGIPAGMASDPVLRYHPACAWRQGDDHGKAPAMLARIYQDSKPVTLHRTFLTSDVPVRKMVMSHNSKLDGCYIPLGGMPGRNGHLGVAEGIESALSARYAYELQCPVWATYCAVQLERFKMVDGLSRLMVYSDNDESYTGQVAAYTLAKRTVKAGVPCHVYVPFRKGDDYNDLIRTESELSKIRTYHAPAGDGDDIEGAG